LAKFARAVHGKNAKGGIAMATKPFLVYLTFLGFQVNRAIERGYGDKVTFTTIYKGIEWGTLIEDLGRKLPKVIDFGPFLIEQDQRNGLFEALRFVASGMKGRERKYGIQKNGLSLLMAFILEAIQQECWTQPRKTIPVPIGVGKGIGKEIKNIFKRT
jgi:hypothetical protein